MRKRPIKRILLALAAILVVAFGLLAYSFAPRKIDVKAYEAETTTFNPPENLNAALLPETTLSLIKCGKMTSRESFVYRGGSWSRQYESGMAAILVRHPKAVFLFDTGFGKNVDEHVKSIPFLMRKLTKYDKEQSAASQLERHGIRPDQIDMILISHSHWDHVSGWEDFPGVEGWMTREEALYSRALPESELMKRMLDKVKVREIDLSGPPYENFDRSFDLFGDGAVILVPLEGHTPGSMGMYVNLRSGKRFLFIGDLTWAIEGAQLPAERPWISRKLVDNDEEKVRRSIVRVHQLMTRYPDLIVVPAHDRRAHDKIAIFPEVER
jgi:glyoxylase-like metal-dependent hydrolase (beta-lactamase superfamily II)